MSRELLHYGTQSNFASRDAMYRQNAHEPFVLEK
jgi:hypothetical protein